jgi:hypothetical protein
MRAVWVEFKGSKDDRIEPNPNNLIEKFGADDSMSRIARKPQKKAGFAEERVFIRSLERFDKSNPRRKSTVDRGAERLRNEPPRAEQVTKLGSPNKGRNSRGETTEFDGRFPRHSEPICERIKTERMNTARA